jgi:hypothetical protein
VVVGFDEAVAGLALGSLSKTEIAGMVRDVCGKTGPVALFEQLSNGAGSLTEGWQILCGFLKPRVRTITRRFDVDDALELFSEWFLALLRVNPIPAKIRALNFGLFESDGGCRVYVIGETTNSAADPNRTPGTAWRPQGYAPIDALSKIYGPLRTAGGEPWVVAQAIVILLIRAFFVARSEEVKTLLGRRKLFITCGFDDGDLYAVRTPVSPRR